MFGDFETADIIAYWCALVDNECRKELRPRPGGLPGVLKNERDYVSALSKGIRDRIGPRFPCLAETIDQGTEMEHGVDGLILFRFGAEVKVGWYEAKWPRVLQADYHWDSPHKVRLVSHFTEQILKQHNLPDSLAIWEMFFNEAGDGYATPPFNAYGSSCVWHEHAYEFMKNQGIIYDRWTTDRLKELLALNGTSFYSIIYDVISCKRGTKMKINKGASSVTIPNPRDPDYPLEVPLPEAPETMTEIKDDRITSFMAERNIAGYLYIDLENGKSHE